jgi:hypothetical protein
VTIKTDSTAEVDEIAQWDNPGGDFVGLLSGTKQEARKTQIYSVYLKTTPSTLQNYMEAIHWV